LIDNRCAVRLHRAADRKAHCQQPALQHWSESSAAITCVGNS
jgi:hypothetical protein